MPVSFQDRDTRRIEFGDRGDAKDVRADIRDEALLDSDDRRQKSVQIDTSELSDRQLREIEGEAAVSRDDARGDMHGQVALTDGERARLDFSETSVPEARTAKASLLSEGVSDWTAHFDPTLTTSEMADKARSTQASGGARMDSADTQRAEDRRMADARRQVQSQQARRARDGCEDGFEEACDQLVEEHGFSRQEAERLLRGQQAQTGAGAAADGGVREETILRAAAHGQFIGGAEPAPRSPGYRSDRGRYVGYEIDEHDPVRRSPATGRIRSMAAAEAVPRPEQVERFGEPDSGDSGRSERYMIDMSAPGQGFLSDSQAAAGLGGEEVRETVFTAQAQSADVSLAPDEALRGVGAVGETAMRPGTVTTDDGDSLIAQDLAQTRGGGAIGLFEAAPDELPGGFEFAGGQTSGDGRVREARFARPEQDIPDAERQFIDVQEINGSFSLYGGFEGPGFDETDRTPVFSADSGDTREDAFDAAATVAQQRGMAGEQESSSSAGLGANIGTLSSEQGRSEAADTGGRLMTDGSENPFGDSSRRSGSSHHEEGSSHDRY